MDLKTIGESIRKINEKRRISFTKDDFKKAAEAAAQKLVDTHSLPNATKEMLIEFSEIFYSTYYSDASITSTTVYLFEKSIASALVSSANVMKEYEAVLYEFMSILDKELMPEMPKEISEIRDKMMKDKIAYESD